MTAYEIVNASDLGLDKADWENPSNLDNHLFERNLLRSDAGSIPGDSILITTLANNEIDRLEEIGACLALQRSVICVMSCDQHSPDMKKIRAVADRVEIRSQSHQILYDAELETIGRSKQDPEPPASIYTYRQGTVIGMMRRAVDGMNERSYSVEACGVANYMSIDDDVISRLDFNRYNAINPARGSEAQERTLPLEIRNNLAWLQRNPNADENGFNRYLKSYGRTVKSLASQIY